MAATGILHSRLAFGILIALTLAMVSVGQVGATLDPTFASGDLAQGESWSHVFPEPGTYAYICGPHPWMEGAIQVTEGTGSGSGDVTVEIRDYLFDSAEVTIPVGGEVTWVNRDAVIHTAEQVGADRATTGGGHGMMRGMGMSPWWLMMLLVPAGFLVALVVLILAIVIMARRPPKQDG